MMLSFQNLHQFVFNLSQVTSTVSSAYVRLTSTSVKKKPEVDVLCSESFLNTLRTLEQSESANIFKHLQNVQFGPSFDDMQWIFSKDVNFRFTAGKSVNKSDVYISLDKNDLKGYYLHTMSKKLGSSKNSEIQRSKILADVERQLFEKCKWSESYVSKQTFDENKKSSACGTYNRNQLRSNSPFYNSLVGTISLDSNLRNAFYVQKRGFKTRREMDKTNKTDSNIFSKFQNLFDRPAKDKDLTNKMFGNNTTALSDIMNTASATPEDRLRMKASFAEGYSAALKEFRKPESTLSKLSKVLWFVVGVLIVASFFFSSDGKRRVFNVSFGRHGEIDPEEIDVTFADVKGVQEVKEELVEIVEFLRAPAKFSSLGGKLPKGVLLVGPPGTGKTLLARAVAGEANVPFFHVSGSEFDEIFVGEGARRVRNLFRAAKMKAPSIIFIDEIDCIGSKRKSTMLHPYANQTINQLLSEMDGFNKNEGVIVIGATNRKQDLDSALLRPGRFDVEIIVPRPNIEGRKEILELYMSKILCKDIDIPRMAKATIGCTGADLEAIINHAAIRAATDGAPYVTMEYLEIAREKIMHGPERKLVYSDEEVLMIAYHEGGHAIVAHFTEAADPIDKVTIVPRGDALGYTFCLPEYDNVQTTKAQLLAKLDVLMGGRAAEELLYGPNKVTTGAGSDLEKATTLASFMIKKFGMSEKIGVRTFSNSNESIVSVNEFGQTVTDQVDSEVKRLLQESYERSKNILKKHAKEHKLLVDALMKYKTLNAEDVKAILGDSSPEKGLSSTNTHN